MESLAGTLVLTLMALLIRYSLSPLIHPFAIFHFFILSCLATQFFFGYRYALTAVVASVFLGEYFFVEPIGMFDQLLIKDVIVSLNFVVVTVAAITLMEILQRGVYARELLLKVNDSRHLISLQRENDRLFYAQKSSDAWVVLETLIQEFDQVILLQYGQDTIRLEPLFYELTGQRPHEVEPHQWLEYVHPDDRDLLVQRLASGGMSKLSPSTFSLRFADTTAVDPTPIAVNLTRHMFMGQALSILVRQ